MTTFDPPAWQFGDDPRVRVLGPRQPNAAGWCVLYWMQNAQRARDNAALDLAIRLANERNLGTVVFFALDETVPYAADRSYTFMLEGLRETQQLLAERGLPLVVRRGRPVDELSRLADELRPVGVVTDLSPLRRGRALRRQAAERLAVPLLEVDSEHLVPLRLIGREHWAARTIRPVIQRHLPHFLEEPRAVQPKRRGPALDGLDLVDLDLPRFVGELAIDHTVPPVLDRPAGSGAAVERLERFVESGLHDYASARRGSGLSPYLRFGQISALRVALAVQAAEAPAADRAAFLEELVVRRELAANFVYYNPAYSQPAGLPDWARRTLDRHTADRRPYLYGRAELLAAATHDPAWNGAQRELLRDGRIQTGLRMYWGKKILEWSSDYRTALATALELNDRYALDGRGASGFASILWCFGRHDRPWPERPIYGTVRTMTAEGLRRKLDLKEYLARV